ncbi:MAG TPA: hypothetical protein VIJ86_01230 [Acidimicrobiales bacterium]
MARAVEAEGRRHGNSRWGLLDELADNLLRATAHAATKDAYSIAIDGTTMPSWGTRRRTNVVGPDGTTIVERISTDPDAHWRGRSKESWKRPVFGYDITGAVRVKDIDGDNVPMALLAMRFRPATTTPVKMALSVTGAVAKTQEQLGDVLVDREYTKNIDGSDFILPVRSLGGEPIFDLDENQRGGRGTRRGALIIDGQPFSPSLPTALHDIKVPAVNATIEERLTYQAKIAARAVYAMKPYGSRKADSQQTYECPASAGQLKCPLRAPHGVVKRGTLRVYSHPTNVVVDSVCAHAFTTFAATDIPLAQRELYGSAQWFFSCARRNRVEGFFGNTKNEAVENLRRGVIRMRGGMKTGLATLVILGATNLRLAERWDAQVAKPKKAKRGRPRRQSLITYSQVVVAASSTGPPAT